jgi:hypothetical protein
MILPGADGSIGADRLNGRLPPEFLESGKTLNDLGQTGAIICNRDHICAPPPPRLA